MAEDIVYINLDPVHSNMLGHLAKNSDYALTLSIPLKPQHTYFPNTDSLQKGQLKDPKCYTELTEV